MSDEQPDWIEVLAELTTEGEHGSCTQRPWV
jgi:hypothetical protein